MEDTRAAERVLATVAGDVGAPRQICEGANAERRGPMYGNLQWAVVSLRLQQPLALLHRCPLLPTRAGRRAKHEGEDGTFTQSCDSSSRPHCSCSVEMDSRWPCRRFFVLGYLFRQILGPLCHAAFESFVSEGKTISGETTEADWHKVRGNRSKRFLTYLGDKEALRSTVVLSVALEPLRFFVQWLLMSARETPSQDDPALVSLAYAPTSPVHAMLQYIGAVLAGQSSRLVLVYRSGGFATYAAWCAGSGAELRELRRLLLP